MVALAAVPSLSQIHAWGTAHLEDAAEHWSSLAWKWEGAFTDVHEQSLYPGGTLWHGAGADAAMLRTGMDKMAVSGLADSLHTAAAAARNGAEDVDGARQLALEAIADARGTGFTVGEDLSVTPPATTGVLRQAQAQGLAAAIRTRAEELVAVDTEVAGKVTAAIAGVNSVQFGSNPVTPTNKKSEIQAVDFKQDPPPKPPPGPNANDIRGVLDKLPEGTSPNIRVVKSQQDLDNLWNWMKQNGIDKPGAYGPKPGEMVSLPDGTIVGRREAASSTEQPALDVRVPGKDGYVKVHINPTEGGVPEIPKAGDAVVPKPPPAEAPRPPVVATPEPPVVEALKPPPVPPLPEVGGMPIAGGPGAPFGPTFVPPPHSIHHLPILGEDDPDAPWEYEP
jgi:hypothetical protein